MDSDGRKHHAPTETLRILRLTPAIGEMSAPLNQFSLPMARRQEITICTYFRSGTEVPQPITLLEGDGSLGGFFGALQAALAAKRYEIVHAHSPHVACLFLLAWRRWRRCPPATVCTIHSSYQNYGLRNRLLFLPVFASFQRIVCCGRPSFDSFPVLYKRLAGRRLCAISNGVDLCRVDRVVTGTRDSRPDARPTIVCVGRLIRIKDPFTILEAFQRSGDHSARLVFIGDGENRGRLLEARDRLGLGGRVEVTGLIRREEVFQWLTRADLFVSASLGEGLPVAVLEAMACRCPVVLSDIPPHREIADGADLIPLCPAGDTAAFSRQIRRFIEMASSERAAIGQKCRQLVEDRFQIERMLGAYESLYRDLLERRPAGGAGLPSIHCTPPPNLCSTGSSR